jgi:hypothetical protein
MEGPTIIRIVAGVLFVIVLVILIQRRRLGRIGIAKPGSKPSKWLFR